MKTKIFLSTLLLLMTAAIVWGQIPQTLSYQGVLTDPSGAPVANGNYSLTFRIYTQATGGNPLWTETQPVTTSSGVFNVILGSVSALNLPFDQTYWVGIIIGNDLELASRTQLTASAYSLNARSIADGAVTGSKIAPQTIDITKLNFTPITAETDPQVGANTTNYVPKWDGTALMSGTIFDNGKVGVGTTSPSLPLQVSKAGPYNKPAAGVMEGATAWAYLLADNAFNNSVIWDANRDMRFGTETGVGSGYSEWMRITKNGNVGIGKTNPTQKLDVNGGIAVNGRLVIDAFGNWMGGKTFAACRKYNICPTEFPLPQFECSLICGAGKVKAAYFASSGSCTVTSDTGPCNTEGAPCGLCCVCTP